eukprot:scaffold1028_cov135-Cylindrotheca_fusiformis.AAC.14
MNKQELCSGALALENTSNEDDQTTRKRRRTKQTLSAPRHVDRNVQDELSKLVWVTDGKTEHQAWLLEELGGNLTVLIRWESTGQQERVPILSVRHEGSRGSRRIRSRQLMDTLASVQQSRKRPKGALPKPQSSKSSSSSTKCGSRTEQSKDASGNSEGAQGDSEAASKDEEPGITQNSESDSLSSTKDGSRPTMEMKRGVTASSITENGRIPIPVSDKDSGRNMLERNRIGGKTKNATSKNKLRLKKVRSPLRVSEPAYYASIPTLRTIERFDERCKTMPSQSTVLCHTSRFLEC